MLRKKINSRIFLFAYQGFPALMSGGKTDYSGGDMSFERITGLNVLSMHEKLEPL
jgi:hypothetical protein